MRFQIIILELNKKFGTHFKDNQRKKKSESYLMSTQRPPSLWARKSLRDNTQAWSQSELWGKREGWLWNPATYRRLEVQSKWRWSSTVRDTGVQEKKENKIKQTTINYAYQVTTFRRPDKHAGSATTACSLGQRCIRGVVGLARIGNILIG